MLPSLPVALAAVGRADLLPLFDDPRNSR